MSPAGHVTAAIVKDKKWWFGILAGGVCTWWWSVDVEFLRGKGTILVGLGLGVLDERVAEEERDEVGESWSADFG